VTGALPVIAQVVPGYLENPPGEIRTVSPVVQVPVKLEKGLLHGVLGIGPACTSAHQVTAQRTAQFREPVQKLLARSIRSLGFVDIRHYPKSIRTTIQHANLLRDKARIFGEVPRGAVKSILTTINESAEVDSPKQEIN